MIALLQVKTTNSRIIDKVLRRGRNILKLSILKQIFAYLCGVQVYFPVKTI